MSDSRLGKDAHKGVMEKQNYQAWRSQRSVDGVDTNYVSAEVVMLVIKPKDQRMKR
jgi:hypothetical protein